MKNILAFLFVLFSYAASAQGILDKVCLYVDREDGCYEVGDTLHIWAKTDRALNDTLELTMFHYTRKVEGFSEKVVLPAGESLVYSEALNEPVAGWVSLGLPGEEGERVGFIAGCDSFRPGLEEPRDLERFWRKEVRKMRREKMEPILTRVPINSADSLDYEAFDLEINCTGPQPVRGLLVMPKNAPAKSLPIGVLLHGGGVAAKHCRCTVENALSTAKMTGGIGLDINAHGMKNLQDDEYYKAFENNEAYHYLEEPGNDHKSYYFRTMYLRIIRALDFATALPCWDGRRILLTGTSQGGQQSCAVAGIDKRVTHVLAIVPGAFDLGGEYAGRSHTLGPILDESNRGSGQHRIAPYYDTAFLLRHSRAKVYIEMGLLDSLCPASNILTGMNILPGSMDVEYHISSHRPHGSPKDKYRKLYKPTDEARERFLENFRKN